MKLQKCGQGSQREPAELHDACCNVPPLFVASKGLTFSFTARARATLDNMSMRSYVDIVGEKVLSLTPFTSSVLLAILISKIVPQDLRQSELFQTVLS